MRKLHVVWVILILFFLEQWIFAHRPEKAFPLGIGAGLLLIGFEILYWAQVLEARIVQREMSGTQEARAFGRGTMLGISVLGSMTAVCGFIFLVVGYLFYVLF